MVRVRFDPTDIQLDSYFRSSQQVGSGGSANQYFEGLPFYQRWHGGGPNWFAGMPRQGGAGLGDIFRSFWRVLKPFAKSLAPVITSAGKAVGQEGLAATSRILNDVVQGGDLKESVLNQGREGVQNLLGRAERKLASQRGKGSNQRKRKRQSVSKIILKPEDVIGRFVPAKAIKNTKNSKKKRHVDALGSY